MSLSIRLHLISCLFQGTAVYQSKAPAQRHTQIHKHTLKTLRSNENVNSAMEKKKNWCISNRETHSHSDTDNKALLNDRLVNVSLPVQELQNKVFKLSRSETQILFNLWGRKEEMTSICRILQCVILFLCMCACLGRKLLKCNSDTERGELTKQLATRKIHISVFTLWFL